MARADDMLGGWTARLPLEKSAHVSSTQTVTKAPPSPLAVQNERLAIDRPLRREEG